MDWTDPMMAMFGLNSEPQAQTDAADDDEDDFYDDAAKTNGNTEGDVSGRAVSTAREWTDSPCSSLLPRPAITQNSPSHNPHLLEPLVLK